MWWRFLTFCVLVSFILFVVASCIYGRPSIHLFFHRCCGDDIENDHVIYENFGHNFLKERLIGGDIIEADNETFVEGEDIGRINDDMKEVLSIYDPEVKIWIKEAHISDSDMQDAEEDKNEQQDQEYVKNFRLLEIETEEVTETASTLHDTILKNKFAAEKVNNVPNDREENEDRKIDVQNYELLQTKAEDITEASTTEFLNVHDWKHKRIVGSL